MSVIGLSKRERPYADQHERSKRTPEPLGFRSLLNWFVSGFTDETPTDIHGGGVWVGRAPKLGSPDEEYITTGQVGGSLLGSPGEAEPFRQLIENSPRQRAGDGDDEHYPRPMRAALSVLAGKEGSDSALMARYLVQVAFSGGDWEGVADRWHMGPWGRAITEQALRRLHHVYRPEPPARMEPRRAAPVGGISEAQSRAVYGDSPIAPEQR